MDWGHIVQHRMTGCCLFWLTFCLFFRAVSMICVWKSHRQAIPEPARGILGLKKKRYLGKWKYLAANVSNILRQTVQISCGKRFKYLVANGSNLLTKSRKIIPPHRCRAWKHGIWSPGA